MFDCVFVFNPCSFGYRMTQIGNTISGVTGLQSVWWTLVMLSPSLLTPGSKCMHGRSEIFKSTNRRNYSHLSCCILFILSLLLTSACFPFTLTLCHVNLLSPCIQISQLEESPLSSHRNDFVNSF